MFNVTTMLLHAGHHAHNHGEPLVALAILGGFLVVYILIFGKAAR